MSHPLEYSLYFNFCRNRYSVKANGSYWMDDVRCYGHETNLGHCWSRRLGSHNCEASEEAGVICSNVTDPGRLKPLPSKASGKVFEVFMIFML